jgi:hypothetical protein
MVHTSTPLSTSRVKGRKAEEAEEAEEAKEAKEARGKEQHE